MNDFLRKIQLIQKTSFVLHIDKHVFVERLKANVDVSNLGFWSDSTDVFSSSKNDYKGQITHEGFKIRRRRSLFDFNRSMATAAGTYTQKGDELHIEATINGFPSIMYVFYGLCLLFYGFGGIMLFAALFTGEKGMGFYSLPFLLLHAVFMLGIPYVVMRKTIGWVKKDLEKTFYFWTRTQQ